jgi:hypothetical protein
MALPILSQQIAADCQHIENQLSVAKTSTKHLLVLKEPAIVLAQLHDLGDALSAINEYALRGRVRINMALNELKGVTTQQTQQRYDEFDDSNNDGDL